MNWDAFQREALQAMGHVLYDRAAPQRAALPDDALLRALLRAAGRGAEDEDAAALARGWPALASLRGNAAAKRALWPALRVLRKQGSA